MRYLILGAGAVASGLYLCVVAAVRPLRESGTAWLFALPIFLIVSGAVAMLLYWPEVKLEREVKLTEIERLKTQAYYSRRERNPQPEPLTPDAEAERQYRWHRFWAACLEYAADNGGFHYRNNFERILKHEHWLAHFAIPLVKAGWLEPVQSSIKTKAMAGWTATRMLAALSAGTPPPYPDGEPPDWKQTASENTRNMRENIQFASEHRK